MTKNQDDGGDVLINQDLETSHHPSNILTIRAGAARECGVGGAIRFALPCGKEAFRIEADGFYYIGGKIMTCDYDLYRAMKAFFEGAS